MKNRYVRTIIIALGALIVFMLLAPVFFKGKIRELAVKEVNKNINATVSLGDIKISLFRNFPKVYIGLKNLTIEGKGAFLGDTLAHIPVLALVVDVVDLIDGSPYSVDRIGLQGPDIRLRVMHDGSANWDIALPGGNEAAPQAEEEPDNFILQLKSLGITNGKLLYEDVSSQVYVVMKGLDHQLSGDLTADRTRLDTRTTVNEAYVEYGLVPYLNRATLDLVAVIDADLQNSIYRLEHNSLKINELALNFEGSLGYVGDDLNLLLTFRAPENTFKNVLSLVPAVYSRDFASIRTDGTFTFEGFVKGVYNETDLPAFKASLLVNDAWFSYPDLPGKVDNIQMDLQVENPGGDADNTVIDARKVQMTILENDLSGSLHMATPLSDPDIQLQVQGKLDLEDISQVYPLEEGEELSGALQANIELQGRLSDAEKGDYQAFRAMGSLVMSGITYRSAYFQEPVSIATAQVNFSPAYLDLVNLAASLGQSSFQARGKIEDYLSYFLSDGLLKGNLVLDATTIDLNELMAAGPEEEAIIPDAESTASLPDTAELSAFLVPGNLDLSLDATIGTLFYETIRMDNLVGRVEIQNSKLILKGLTVEVFGGKMLLNGSYETTDPSSPIVDLTLGLTGTDIGQMAAHIPVMEKYAPIASKTLGTLTGNINLASVLDEHMMPLYETVTGLGNMKTSTLEISGVNTLNALANALKMESLKVMELTPLNLSFQFMEGVLNIKPFDIRAGEIAMNLSGWTSLNQEIGYVLDMKVPRSAFGPAANDVLEGLFGKAGQWGVDLDPGEKVELKALIDGTLSDPRLKIDLAGTGKGIIEEVKEEIKEEVINKASEEAEKIMREAEARADAVMAQAQKEVDKLMQNADKLAQEVRNQANLNAEKLEKEAKDKGALAVLAAKKSAEELRKQGDKQAQNILDEAKKQSDNVMQKARQEADKIMQDARDKASSLK